MGDFIGASEIALRAEMSSATNKIQAAKIEAEKVEKTGNASEKAYFKQLKKVTQEFESIFLGYMLKQMRKSVPKTELFGNSMAQDIFTEMHDETISKELAKAGGIGIAAMLYSQLSENAGPPPGGPASPNIDIKK